MTLSDGTFLRAAEGASLEFPAEAGRREVVLHGRAFFAVAHGERPFVARTGGAPRVMTVADVWALLDWPSGLLALQRTSLDDVAG
jgi:ferric-dicitrate binding protein FerR (iron transport regulator)